MNITRAFLRASPWCALLLLLMPAAGQTSLEPEGDKADLIGWLLHPDREYGMTPFREVVRAATGHKILPFDPQSDVDRLMVKKVAAAMDAIMEELRSADHHLHRVGRINEVSGHIENMLQEKLDALDGFICGIPPTADGRLMGSGYPDLRFEHLASGRVFYLDPKVYRSGSERSTFRTFYFEPKVETNKINDDATHIIVGLAHLGKIEDLWTFESWKLIDLYDFEVRLKAEFQASNRDMYRDEAVIKAMARDE